jgi:hypothetical protein
MLKKIACLGFILSLASLVSLGCGLGGKASPPSTTALQVTEPLAGAVSEGRSFAVKGTAAPGATIRVECVEGGTVVETGADSGGGFSIDIPAEAGTNTFAIEADDGNGKASTVRQVVRNARFLLVTPRTLPYPEPDHVGEVFLFLGKNKEAMVGSIPTTMTDDPVYPTFSPSGELFIGQRCGSTLGRGSVARYLVDDEGRFTPNGVITGNGLDNVHGVAFSPAGELFAGNLWTGIITRFTFDAAGNAVPHGTFQNGLTRAQGLAFSPWGEFFSAGHSDKISRFIIDPVTGAAVPNGIFTVPGAQALHGVTFSADGELFTACVNTNTVYRFLFDENRDPVAHGTIAVPHPALGVAWSPARELFVSTHLDEGGGLYRYLINRQNEVVTGNGFIPLGSLGGVAVREKEAE